MTCCYRHSLVALPILLVLYLFIRCWRAGRKCRHRPSLSGKTVIITGGNAGIGYETARTALECDAHVIIGCRNAKRGQAAVASLKQKTSKSHVEYLPLDLASFPSIREFARMVTEHLDRSHRPLYGLVLNAGIMANRYATTEQGHESNMGINHIGHFYLTSLLHDTLLPSAARVVIVSSLAADMCRAKDIPYPTVLATPKTFTSREYFKSKLANIWFMHELNKRFLQAGSKARATAIHPGVVATNLFDNQPRWASLFLVFLNLFAKTPVQGAQTTLEALLSPELEGQGGAYLKECRVAKQNAILADRETAAKFWDATQAIVDAAC